MIADELYSVKTIPGEYKRLFGRDCDFYDMLELLPIVLRESHGIVPEYQLFQQKVKDFKVILPCVYYSIQYVCLQREGNDIQQLINEGQGILVNHNLHEWRESLAAANEDVVVNQEPAQGIKVNNSFPKKANGAFVDFTKKGNAIEFQLDNMDVEILITLLPVDEKGWPKVTGKVITAMSYFLNYVYVQKRYYSGQVAQYVFRDAKEEYGEKVADASVPTTMSDNDMNDILNALSSLNRHSFNGPARL